MAQNQFLQDFIKMREQLREKEAKSTATKSHKPAASSLNGMPKPTSHNITLSTIIEDKPKKDKVIEYLCHRRDTILEEMDD